MKSWAVTRGPSLDPNEKRLAVHVEDHPIEYNAFEGTIPQGEYGGGTVMIWDRGTWHPEGDPHKGYAKGHLVFDLDGDKLHGRWHLVRMRARRARAPRQLAADQGARTTKPAGRATRTSWKKSRALPSPAARSTRSPQARARNGSGIRNRAAGGGRKKRRRSSARSESIAAKPAASRAAKAKRATHDATQQTSSDKRAERRGKSKLPASRNCRNLFRPALPTLATRRRAGRTGCTKSNSTAIAWRRGSITARCGC